MEIRWYHSLGVRLFALMSICLIVTVGAVTWQQSSVLRDFLHRQLEDGTILKSRELADRLDGRLRYWRGLGSALVMRMAGNTPKAYDAYVASFMASVPELAAVHLIEARTGKTILFKSQPGQPDAKIRSLHDFNLTWVRQEAGAQDGGSLELIDLGSEIDSAMTAVALKFKVSEQKGDLWAMLALTGNDLLNQIPADSAMQAWVLDRDLQAVFHSGREQTTAVPASLSSVIRTAKSGFGFRSYKDSHGQDVLGAYSILPEFGLSVIVTQGAQGAQQAIVHTLLRSLLWAWLFMLMAVMASYIVSLGITGPLKAATLATQRIASGDFDAKLLVTGRGEVAALSQSVNIMADRIKSLIEVSVEAARQEKELETARLVQSTLFPQGAFDDAGLSFHWQSVPASECGGDWIGHFKASDDKHYFFIADATGHGVAAALVTAVAYAVCQSLSELMRSGSISASSPSTILRYVNAALCQTGRGKTTMTLLAACVDLERNEILLANAGHNMPYHVSRHDNRCRKLKARGSPLGFDPASAYDDVTYPLRAGDKILLYTDGLLECCNQDARPWGERALRHAVEALADNDGSSFQRNLLDQAFAHFDGSPLQDDVTAAVIEIAPHRLQKPQLEVG